MNRNGIVKRIPPPVNLFGAIRDPRLHHDPHPAPIRYAIGDDGTQVAQLLGNGDESLQCLA
ncbi:hypothetical protein LTR10_004190 [Elasticomyces elasticus]|nr:hypothetical protein LTR10_004190 [Elasticomyces elasticus]KAK4977626.1 hypothetical protein LTR42_001997 [Elasticomyces elasticus]